jgi:hypothetical protein
MDIDSIKAELQRLATRDVAHHTALQTLYSAAPKPLREKLRRMAATYEDLSLATSIPDRLRLEYQVTLLSIARDHWN